MVPKQPIRRMPPQEHPTVICLSNLDWGFLRYRKQHLMERLAGYLDVVYVNPPRAVKARQWPLRRRTRQLARSLWIHEPFVAPGMRRSVLAKQVSYLWLAHRLKPWRQKAHPLVLWLYSPHGLPFIQLLSPDLVVYDVADLYATPGGPSLRGEAERREIETLRQLEDALLRRADIVLCVSEPLVNWVGSRARQVHLVPNGCDWPRYSGYVPSPSPSGTPRLGYVGSLAPRLDTGLIARLARAKPEWQVELVGPASPASDLSPLRGVPNVTCAGEIPYEAVPGRIASFDVCLLPLHEIDTAYYCSPIQVFDYLAAGKPVVSTPIGQLERWDGLVHLAHGWEGFTSAVADALAERDGAAIARRREFARNNSWDCRVSQILGLLREAGVETPLQPCESMVNG